MSNAILATADNGDADIDYSVALGVLTVGDLNPVMLYIPAGQSFLPGEAVTVGDGDTASDVRIDGSIDAVTSLLAYGDIIGNGTLDGGTAAVESNGDFVLAGYTASSATTRVAGDWQVGTFVPGTGTVEFDGTGSTDAESYANLILSAGTRTAAGDWIVSASIVMSGGAWNPGVYTHSVAGNWDDTAIAFAPSQGTILLTSPGAAITQGAGNNFAGLTLSAGASLNTDLDINRDLNITGGTLLGNGRIIRVAGDWRNTGIYTPGAGAVIFDDPSRTSTIWDTTTFNDLTIATGGKVVRFEATATQSVTGTFTAQGAVGDPVFLRSTVAGNQWLIDAAAAVVDWASVYDSNAVTPITATNSVDGGNNTGWTFTPSAIRIWSGVVDTDWSNAGNWNPAGVPLVTDTVSIPSGTANSPQLTAPVTVATLLIDPGASLDTAGFGLTISTQLQNNGTLYRRAGDTVSRTDTDSGTVTYHSGGGTIQDYGAIDYFHLFLDSAGDIFLTGASLSVVSDLTVASGTFNAAGFGAAVSGQLTVNPGAVCQAGSGAFSVSGDLIGGGILEGGTAAVSVGGEFTVSSYSASTASTTVTGHWSVGSFDHNDALVTLDGSASVAA
jgi:hypothetical protein